MGVGGGPAGAVARGAAGGAAAGRGSRAESVGARAELAGGPLFEFGRAR